MIETAYVIVRRDSNKFLASDFNGNELKWCDRLYDAKLFSLGELCSLGFQHKVIQFAELPDDKTKASHFSDEDKLPPPDRCSFKSVTADVVELNVGIPNRG